MLLTHENNMEEVRRQLWPRTPWYIEVVAVRPSQQGMGLGGKMIRAINDMAGQDPVVLECTDAANIGFYQRYGFEVVKEVALKDAIDIDDEGVLLYLMLRR